MKSGAVSATLGLPAVALEARSLAGVAFWLGVAAIAFATLAFGGVYPWGYWPLVAAGLVSGLVGLTTCRDVSRGYASRPLTIAFGCLGLAMALQLVPLPEPALAAVSGRTMPVVRQLDPVAAIGLSRWHTLSIDPSRTAVGLALYGAFAIFLLGFTRLLSIVGARRFADAMTIAGVVLALVGIVQKPLDNGHIYGFWTPVFDQGHVGFGPFVNRNHFAGWMLLVLPISLARFSAGIERSMIGLKGDWHRRVLWFASPDASRVVMTGGAVIVMALSLVLTTSRSGMTALGFGVLLMGVFIARSHGSRSRKTAGFAYLILLGVVVGASVGVDAIVMRFSNTDWTEFNNRRGAWVDSLAVASDFPVTGTGLNTYGTANLLYQRHDLEKNYTESHNDYLQLAAEGGALLVIPATACLIVFIRDVRRRLREPRGSTAWWLRAGAVTALVAIALQETVEFSLQIPADALLFAAICALALHQGPART
jgi:O-antigen ligase